MPKIINLKRSIMGILRKKNGVTITELIAVIVILAIITAIAIPLVGGLIENTRIAADRATVGVLNNVTTLYSMTRQSTDRDIFSGFTTDEQRLEELVSEGFLSGEIQPQHDEGAFIWSTEDQLWFLYNGDELIPLSPLGSTFEEITTGFIDLMHQQFVDTGSYGRTWGDYAYTDIGLEPEDWAEPIVHVYFKPVGSRLQIRPEDGYVFLVEDMDGDVIQVTYRSNFNLIYNDIDGLWYFRYIDEANLVDITMLEITRG